MPLDPYLAAQFAAPPGERLSAARERAAYRVRALARRPADYGADGLLHVSERSIAGSDGPVPVRVFRPARAFAPAPTVVYLHGGGWVVGDLDTHDHNARAIALDLACCVVSVDYRLAPEHPFSGCLERLLRRNPMGKEHSTDLGGGDSVGVVGDSAGAGLAAGVSLRLRDGGYPQIEALLLLYPALDLTLHVPSMTAFSDGYGLRADDMRWLVDQYAPDSAVRCDPIASPLLAPDLSSLPPAVIVTAHYDPLRDEGDVYADRLRTAGVHVDHRCHPTLAHGFLSLDVIAAVPAARSARDESLALFGQLLR